MRYAERCACLFKDRTNTRARYDQEVTDNTLSGNVKIKIMTTAKINRTTEQRVTRDPHRSHLPTDHNHAFVHWRKQRIRRHTGRRRRRRRRRRRETNENWDELVCLAQFPRTMSCLSSPRGWGHSHIHQSRRLRRLDCSSRNPGEIRGGVFYREHRKRLGVGILQAV